MRNLPQLNSPARPACHQKKSSQLLNGAQVFTFTGVTFLSLLLSHPGFFRRHSETSLLFSRKVKDLENVICSERCAPQRAGLPRLAASEELGGSDTAERICGIRDASAAAGPGGRRSNPPWNSEFEWRRMGKLSRAEHWWRHLAPGFSNMVRWRWWRCRDGTFTNFARHAHTWLRATCKILFAEPAWL